MESIILDTGVKELLVNDTRNFLASKDWYTRRGECCPSVPLRLLNSPLLHPRRNSFPSRLSFG